MRLFVKGAVPALALLALGACTTVDLDKVGAMQAEGGAFNEALKNEYVRLAKLEAAESDFRDANFFGERAQAAGAGNPPKPQFITERRVPDSTVPELADARARLIVGMRERGSDMPEVAAKAQAGFDCWLQEQEENIQQADINACKKDFFAALWKLEEEPQQAAAQPQPAEKALPRVPGPVTINFDHDSSKLSPTALGKIKAAVKAAEEAEVTFIQIAAHTDRSGSAAYNQRLSERRAASVIGALMMEGVSLHMIGSGAYGEDAPAKATPDGQREAANRRVRISFARQ